MSEAQHRDDDAEDPFDDPILGEACEAVMAGLVCAAGTRHKTRIYRRPSSLAVERERQRAAAVWIAEAREAHAAGDDARFRRMILLVCAAGLLRPARPLLAFEEAAATWPPLAALAGGEG